MAGFLIASAHVDIEADVGTAVRNIMTLVTKLTAVGPVAIAAGATAAAALGGIAAGAVAAGAAVGAFGLAAKPQLAEVTAAAKLGEEAQKAMASGASDAAEKQAAYAKALAALPPATRDTAKAFVGLKGDFKEWSDGLASTTMPIFTKGIGILRDMLPSLTPLVKTAAGAFSDMLDGIGEGVSSGGFKNFMDKLNEVAKETLPMLLRSGANVFMGLGGLISAFMPHAGEMTGGLEDMTAKFRAWSEGLGQSEGFKSFMDYVAQNGPMIGSTLADVARTLGNLVMALAPLTGMTLPVLAFLAEQIAKIPAPILTGIAVAITAIKIAMMGWNIYLALTSSAMWPLITATWAWTTALLANPITWIILAIVALIAVIVLIATKTTWFQTAWKFCWDAVKAAWDWVWSGLKKDWKELGHFFTVTIPGWAQTVKDKIVGAWNTVKDKTTGAYNAIKDKISDVWNSIRTSVTTKVSEIISKVTGAWNTVKTKTSEIYGAIKAKIVDMMAQAYIGLRDKVTNIVNKIKEIPGKVKGALGNAKNMLFSAGKNIIQGLIDGVSNMIGSLKSKFSSITNMIPDWKGPMDVDLKLLAPSGKALMSGLMDGIDGEVPVLHSQLGGITRGIPNAVGVSTAGTTASSGGVTVNLNVDMKSMTLPSPSERRAFAKGMANDIADALRNQEKERR